MPRGLFEESIACSVARHTNVLRRDHVIGWSRRRPQGFDVVGLARAVQKPWRGVLEVLRGLEADGLLERREVELEDGQVAARWFAVAVCGGKT